jgi:hypothetical protein
MEVATLTATVIALLVVSAGLLYNKRRKRPVLLPTGLLMASTGALLAQIGHMTRMNYGVRGALIVVDLLLALGGIVCVLVSLTRSTRIRGGTNGNR